MAKLQQVGNAPKRMTQKHMDLTPVSHTSIASALNIVFGNSEFFN